LTTLVIVVVVLGATWYLVRHVVLVQWNHRRHAALGPVLKDRTFLFTQADRFFFRFTVPVILSLTKKNLKIIPSIPFLPVRSVPLLSVKKLGMDTFTPWNAPLDEGRVINVTLREGPTLHFRVTTDIEGWRDWIQSFGFRA
jgi:hypothetical protein